MYTLPSLEYGYDELSPSISGTIMELHHQKHHQGYVDKLNAALETAPAALREQPLEDLIEKISTLPENIQMAIQNQGGGHLNHSLFWQWLSPRGGGEPSGIIHEQLVARYGSYQAFVDEFSAKAMSVFGSGWVWLQPDMEIITTANQDNPLMTGRPAPLLGLDVWEHAYYLDYKNKRDDYIKAWWDVINWAHVTSEREKLS